MDSFIYSGKIIKRLLGAKPSAKHWESTLTKIVTTFQSSQEDRHRTEQAITIKCGELVDRTLADAPSPGIRKSLGEEEGAEALQGMGAGGGWCMGKGLDIAAGGLCTDRAGKGRGHLRV